ncbi:MAG: SBBP repeat-containing protein, partial [candidate division WOR-3 bacterium]
KSYRRVRIKDIYPNIDWVFRYDEYGNFHHEFEIKEPELISKIKIKVKYADIDLTDDSKSIILSTPIGKIKDGNLIGYQGGDIVEVNYRLIDNSILAFDIRDYQKNKPLLIDPHALVWATYYGGSSSDKGYSITTDANGNVFVTGETWSTNFPTQNPGGNAYYQGANAGNVDVFILKFDNSGQRLWATYYGGSSYDYVNSITTDANGNVFVTGYTESTNFPTHNPGGNAYYQGANAGLADLFILKFDNSGQRLWATYYGGSSNDYSYSITTDANGNVFVTGYTSSFNFPTQNPGGGAYYQGTRAGLSDLFILKFDNSGQRLWATYYGGSSDEWGRSITTDANGNVFVTGETTSPDFPTQNPGGNAYYQGANAGNRDLFILKFDNSGQRLWATYYGGSSYDYVNSITTDANGNVFVTGYTESTDFPTYNPSNAYYQGAKAGLDDVFILKFDNSGQRLWATYYGGSGDDYGYSITTDANGNVFVTGYTGSSTSFPTYNPGGGAYYQGANAGGYDLFILKFNNSGQRLWATYYGGSSSDEGYSITTDANGNVFVTGYTNSIDLPTQNPGGSAYYQGANAGGYDAFISKFSSANLINESSIISFKSKLSLNLTNISTPINIKIYSLDGNLIYSNTFKTNNIEINLNNLKSGIYILKAQGKNKSLTYKFIKN